MQYTYTTNKTMLPPMIGIRGDNSFLAPLFFDFMDIIGVMNCQEFKIGPIDHFNIYIEPTHRLEDILPVILQIIDDAVRIEYLLRDINLDGKSEAKQSKRNRPNTTG